METNRTPQAKRLFTTRELTYMALMTAVLCIIAPFTIPLPFSPVPLTLANLALYLMCYVLGPVYGTVATLIYLLLGTAGLPVFSAFGSGLAKLAGPTGGYLLGYLLITLIGGYFVRRFPEKIWLHAAGLVLGTLGCYALGTIWLSVSLGKSILAALSLAVFPYIPGDVAKIILGIMLGRIISKALARIS